MYACTKRLIAGRGKPRVTFIAIRISFWHFILRMKLWLKIVVLQNDSEHYFTYVMFFVLQFYQQ